jgi:class 3 adenylate cyclase/TolB-like protein
MMMRTPNRKLNMPEGVVADPSWLDAHRARRTVLVVDMVDSVQLMQRHEDSVIDRWRRFVGEVVSEVLPALGGRLVKSLGDGMLLEFEASRSAVEAAFELNRRIATYNDPRSPEQSLRLRQGAHAAHVVVDTLDIFGQGVNLAARLATLGRGGELIVSDTVRDEMLPGVDADVEDLGLCYLKNLDRPQRAFRIGPAQPRSLVGSGVGDERAGVAVVPFQTRNASDGDQTLGQVLADDLIAALSRVPELRVVSRLSSNWFSMRDESDATMAGLLGVHYAVRGGFVSRGNRLRVFVNLRELSRGETVWTGEFDSAVDQVVAGDTPAVDDAAAAICRALVGYEVRRARDVPLHNLQSYTVLFAAISLMHRLTRQDFQRAGEMLSYVVARHPRATAPRAWLGKWHVMRVAQGYSDNPESDARQAHAIVGEALDLDSQHSLALAVDGLIFAYISKDLVTAGQRYEAALRANPNEGLALLFQSSWHAYQERGQAAVGCAIRARHLSPLDPLLYYYDNFACLAHLAADDYPAAVDAGVRSLRANRSHASTLRLLAIAQALAGDLGGARASVTELLQLEPGFTRDAFFKRFPGPPGERTTRYGDALRAAGLPDGAC